MSTEESPNVRLRNPLTMMAPAGSAPPAPGTPSVTQFLTVLLLAYWNQPLGKALFLKIVAQEIRDANASEDLVQKCGATPPCATCTQTSIRTPAI